MKKALEEVHELTELIARANTLLGVADADSRRTLLDALRALYRIFDRPRTED